MNATAQQMVAWVRLQLKAMAITDAYRTMDAVYTDMARRTGLSYSTIMKIQQGANKDPRASTLDKLVQAINEINRKQAA